MQSWYQHLQSSALIAKTEPKALRTPLQEHQKELKTQPFGRSHVDDLAILQSWSCNPAILISTSAIICSHLQNRTQNSENTFTRATKKLQNSMFLKIARRWSCNRAILQSDALHQTSHTRTDRDSHMFFLVADPMIANTIALRAKKHCMTMMKLKPMAMSSYDEDQFTSGDRRGPADSVRKTVIPVFYLFRLRFIR